MEKVNAFKYERNLFKIEFNSGTVGFMVAKNKTVLENFYQKRNLLKNVKSIIPVLFGVVEEDEK